jgi:predicted thioredoxin/glutaredoxin
VRCVTNEHLQEFLRLVEEWIQLYYSVGIAGQLPGTERRAQLEKIMWQALQEIVEYTKSEEAAKNAEERLKAMELLNHAVRAELAVLHEQDAFYVQHLINQLEALMREHEEKFARKPA